MPVEAVWVAASDLPALEAAAQAWGYANIIEGGVPLTTAAGAGVAFTVGLPELALIAAAAGVVLMTIDTIKRAYDDTVSNKISKAQGYDAPFVTSGYVISRGENSSQAKPTYARTIPRIERKESTGEYELTNQGVAGSTSIDAMYQALAAATGIRQKGPQSPDEYRSIGSFMESYLRGSSANPAIKSMLKAVNIMVPSVGGKLTMFFSKMLIESMLGTMYDAGIYKSTVKPIYDFVPHTDLRSYNGNFGIFTTSWINGGVYNGYSQSFTPDESDNNRDWLARLVAWSNLPTDLEFYIGDRVINYSGDLLEMSISGTIIYIDPAPQAYITVEGETVWFHFGGSVQIHYAEGRAYYKRSDVTSPWIWWKNEGLGAGTYSNSIRELKLKSGVSGLGTTSEEESWVEKTPGVAVPSTSSPKIEELYPDWASKAIKVATDVDPETGAVTYSDYIPLTPTVPLPDIEPLPVEQAQSGILTTTTTDITQLNPDPDVQKQIEISIQIGQPQVPITSELPVSQPGDVAEPGTGVVQPDVGTVPVVPVPEFEALDGDFYNMYKTSDLSQLRGFNGWLWSTDIVDAILRLFQKPLDSILNFGVVYVPYGSISSVGESGINVGNMTYSTSIQKVTNQRVTIDCGTISIPYYYNNALDYEPYTKIGAYLPFIGEVEWSCADVMNANVNIKYHIDLLTGSSLCIVYVSKTEGVSVPKYVYECNCMTNIPLSGSDFSRLFSSLVTAAVGVASGGASAAGSALTQGALGFMTGSEIPVQKTGGVTSNAGAMGPLTPFAIISRRNMAMPRDYNKFIGYPVNGSYTLGSLKGFTRVSDIHVSGIPATENELEMIETLLKEGVIL